MDVAGISQSVDYKYAVVRIFLIEMPNEVAANKPCASGH